MRYRIAIAAGLMIVVSAQGPVSGAGQALPPHKGRPAVAIVSGEAISLDEFARQLGPSADRARLAQGRGTEAELDLLERLVTIKLIAHEASLIGLDEVPEIRRQVEVSSREILREILIERLVKGVTAPRAEVQKVFHDMVREWKTTSLLFQNAEAASLASKELAGGASFADVGARAVAAGSARAESDDEYRAKKDYLPPIAAALAGLRVGQVSPVVRLSAGFVIVRVVDVRYPENPEALEEARTEVLRRRQVEFLQAHEKTARARYVVIDTAVLEGLDYAAARPGVPALLADKRVVAEIKGAPPLTVGDLTDYLRMQIFHGTDQAKQGRGMNARKAAALDATLARRLLNAEALKLGIDKTHAYRDRVNGYTESLVFDSFVQKVIVPENRLKEEDIRKHYSDHPKDYSYPGMIRARSLAFTARAAAEAALRKLGEGTDFNWLAGNAEGQVSNGGAGLLALDGRPVTIDSMPAGVQKVLASAKAGDFRLYAAPDGRFYVLSVQQVTAPAAKPYDEVREDIAKTVYAAKLKTSVEEYARKLRAQAKVQMYLHKVR